MSAARKYEKLRLQLIDLADELDGEGQDVLSAFATEAAVILKSGLDDVGIIGHYEYYAHLDAIRQTDAELDAREESGR